MKSVGALIVLACGLGTGCNELLLLRGSTCNSTDDCLIHLSCARRIDGCTCKDSACYFDPDAELSRGFSGCRACHGSLANAAPPGSTAGLIDSSLMGVGAHQTHLAGGSSSKPVACEECHVVPTGLGDAGHVDTPLPAEVNFGDLTTATGTKPATWEPTGAICSVYCHGADLDGGTQPLPVWTRVDGSQAPCDGCHGLPPGGIHPQDNSCELCHEPTAGPNRTIANRYTHVDGTLQVSGGACWTCHGDENRIAPLEASPPLDLAGETDSAKVGAHLSHLQATIGADVLCNACHLVPLTYGDPGHDDDGDDIAEVAFQGRAVAAGASPTYAGAGLTCQNTYCHGTTINGGSNGNQSVWTDDNSASACDACHGLPPATIGHIDQNVQPTDPCGTCHEDSASETLAATITTRSLHVDGALQVSGCGSVCHEVPPTTGAHDQHASTQGFECRLCHGHNGSGPQHNEGDGTVVRANIDVVFDDTIAFLGGTTMGNGGTASYDTVATRCTVGCHNPVPGNPDESPNLTNRPTWAAGAINCRACHDEVASGPPRMHVIGNPDRTDCTTCHDISQHTDGTVRLDDKDPSDTYVPTLGTIDPHCMGCHDGGGGSYFGGQTPRDALSGWFTSAHAQDGFRCNDCHTYHVSTTNTTELFVDRSLAGCTQSGCHDDQLLAGFAQSSHHPLSELGGDGLHCLACHNPHLAQASPNSASDPDDKWQLYPMPSTAVSRKNNNYSSFCISCHDGNPPAGVPATALVVDGNTDQSEFYKDGNESLHEKKHDEWNCQTCHDWHGGPGTAGVDRGRLLFPYINVTQFPYQDKDSCSTPRESSGNLGREVNGQWVQFSFGCHD
jgi:predicted CxxxxCH...CXXCH cytochrome family protein